jgi:hypothetical protein
MMRDAKFARAGIALCVNRCYRQTKTLIARSVVHEFLLESAVMPHRAELPEESIEDRSTPANDPTAIAADIPAPLDFDDDAGPVRAPQRFGRLALWMASASALGIGVLGTVAYGVWFTHDQRVYAEAMTSARKNLGIEQPAMALTQSAGPVETAPVSSPYVTTTPIAPADTATLAANTTPSAGDSAAAAGLAAAVSAASQKPDAGAQKTAAATPARKPAARAPRGGQQYASQQARHRNAHAKSDPGLFARMGAFFHRVSYQQRNNVPTRQREEYSRP